MNIKLLTPLDKNIILGMSNYYIYIYIAASEDGNFSACCEWAVFDTKAQLDTNFLLRAFDLDFFVLKSWQTVIGISASTLDSFLFTFPILEPLDLV